MAHAPYACHPEASRGRAHPETEDAGRTCFQRDRDRIIHSAAFRRLEYKTQVFVNHEGDHYRTRLTHSLEVAQIARSLARALALDEDLTEALALAHDLGHPPFGHAGEEGLNEAMAEFGGFDHNAHTLRIVTRLEHRYAEFNGLNLTHETLEGISDHNAAGTMQPSLEAQIASLSDDIAYNNHDIDDGLRAGLFTVEDLRAVPEMHAYFAEVQMRYPGLEAPRLIHEALRRSIHAMCLDVLSATRANIQAGDIQSLADVQAHPRPLAMFSAPMQQMNTTLKAFLMERMYRHYKVNRMSSKARRVVRELFAFFLREPECLPTLWRALSSAPGAQATAETVRDYIAGMTDRYALDEHRRIFDVNARS